MLNDLGGSGEYHDYLRDFMKRHTAFCAFTLGNADLITTEDDCRVMQEPSTIGAKSREDCVDKG